MSSRLVQRLSLKDPLDGLINDSPVRILNISLRGALVETAREQKVGSDTTFRAKVDRSIILESRVRRCEVERFDPSGNKVYHVARHYPQASLEAKSRLPQFLIDLLNEEIEKWKRNVGDEQLATNVSMFEVADHDISAEAEVSRRGLVWHRLIDGTWHTSSVASALQPLDGFCVSENIEQDELSLLQESYEQSDPTGRKLIRLLASAATRERS